MSAALIYIDPSIVGNSQAVKVGGVCYFRIGDSQTAIDTFAIDSLFEDCDDCEASPSPSPSPSPEQFCVDTVCANDWPSIALTVNNLGATETINYGGKVWNLPGDNGLTQCVCPNNYVKQKYGVTPPNTSAVHKWEGDGSFFFERFFTGIGNTDRGVLKMSFDATFAYSIVTGFGFTSIFFPDSNIVNEGDPASADSVINNMPDAYFFSYTDAGNVTYKWDKGQDW